MPAEPSVTSACEGPRSCTLRYLSALLPKSFERPGPKSVSPAVYCSGVEVVVWCKWIVDMCAPFLLPETSGILDQGSISGHTDFRPVPSFEKAKRATYHGFGCDPQ